MPRTSSNPLTQKSKHISYLLRHDKRMAELVDGRGFASLRQINSCVGKDGCPLFTEEDLIAVTNNPETKKRFEFEYRSDHGSSHDQNDHRQIYIRALNGHSFELQENIFDPFPVDYSPSATPTYIYHATNQSTVPVILREGLKPMSRQFVHLYEQAGQVKFDPKRNTLLQVGPLQAVPELLLYRSRNGYIMAPGIVPPQIIQLARK